MVRVALEPAEYPYFDYRRFTFSLGIVANGTAWLSGATAVRFDKARGGMIVDGDLVAQARVILDKMRCTLAAGELGLDDVVRHVEYVTPAALPALAHLAELRREVYGQRGPSVSTILVKSLLRAEALVEIEAVASRGRPSDMVYVAHAASDEVEGQGEAARALEVRGLLPADVVRRLVLATPTVMQVKPAASEPKAGLRIVMPRLASRESGVQVELSASRSRGVLAVTVEGDPAAGDVVGQTREAYARIARTLENSGSSLDAVVKTTEFVVPTALAGYRQTADVRREVFAAPYPAATGVICERLPRAGGLIAVEAIAVIAEGLA